MRKNVLYHPHRPQYYEKYSSHIHLHIQQRVYFSLLHKQPQHLSGSIALYLLIFMLITSIKSRTLTNAALFKKFPHPIWQLPPNSLNCLHFRLALCISEIKIMTQTASCGMWMYFLQIIEQFSLIFWLNPSLRQPCTMYICLLIRLSVKKLKPKLSYRGFGSFMKCVRSSFENGYDPSKI